MKIGIIAAMDNEIKPLIENFKNIKTQVIANQTFTIVSINHHQLVLLQCGVGKVNSAIGATLLNFIFQPDYVINIGSAGAFSQALNIGDIVIASKVAYSDVDLTVFGYEFGQSSKMPAFFESDKPLVSLAENCANQFQHFSIKKGLMVSGDSFISQNHQIDFVKNKFPEVLAADMEACSIAHVCFTFNTPFIVIRSISDFVGSKHNEATFKEMLHQASRHAVDFTSGILHELEITNH